MSKAAKTTTLKAASINAKPAKAENIKDAVATLDEAHLELEKIRSAVSTVILGQDEVIEHALTAILAGGHALLVGVPGLAKTLLVETLGTVLGLDQKRIQFTPDLMPADIVGSEVMDEKDGRRSFRYIKGPVFTELLMADEINRASPRTQSALLQAMQEHHVTVAGMRYDLPEPFHVLATQNPLEQEGTYPLPEAQLDRFLLQIDIGYPDMKTERQIVLETTGAQRKTAEKVITAQKLLKLQQLIRAMPMPESVIDGILKLVHAARPTNTDMGNDAHNKNHIAWGPGPRASQALSLCARARALYNGRLAPSLDDVRALAVPVLQHRMALNFAARAEGLHVRTVISEIAREVL